MPSARAVIASSRRVVTGGLPRRVRQAASPGPVKRVSPSARRSSVDVRPDSPGSQVCAMRPPRSARSSSAVPRMEPFGSAERAALCSATGRRSAS